jgi:hypothetical protein
LDESYEKRDKDLIDSRIYERSLCVYKGYDSAVKRKMRNVLRESLLSVL